MKIKFKIAFIMLLFTGQAIAGGSIAQDKIDKVAFQSGGFFMYADGWGNPNNCQRSDAIVLLSDGSNYDKAYSLLLAAYMSGKEISGYSDGCTTFDEKTYNTIRGHKYLVVYD